MDSSNTSARVHALITALLSYGAFLAAYIIRFYLMRGAMTYGFFTYNILALLFALLHYIVFSLGFYHRNDLNRRFGRHVQGTILCEAVCFSIMLSGLYMVNMPDSSRLCLIIAALLSLLINCAKHSIVLRITARNARNSLLHQRSLLLIGEGKTAERYAAMTTLKPEYGHRIDGVIADTPIEGFAFLGSYDMLDHTLASRRFDEAMIALPADKYIHIDAIISSCEHTGVPLHIIPCYEEHIGGQIATGKFDDIQLIGIRDIPLNRMYNAFIKRCMDVSISLTALVLLSPVMLLIALGVKLSTHDTIFFTQERVGKDNRTFHMLKFRSMRKNEGEQSAWSTQSDDRRTFFGSLIRKLSLDELPQLLNVLRGEMSIVGPRPEIPHFVDQFKDEIPLYMIRHAVKPGITGLAQVRGFRGDTSLTERIKRDIEYIENWTVWMDIRIILRTALVMINDEKIVKHRKKK